MQWNNNTIRLACCNIACDPRGWLRGYRLSVSLKVGIHYTGQCWNRVWWDFKLSCCKKKTWHTYQTSILSKDQPNTSSKIKYCAWQALLDFNGSITVSSIIYGQISIAITMPISTYIDIGWIIHQRCNFKCDLHNHRRWRGMAEFWHSILLCECDNIFMS